MMMTTPPWRVFRLRESYADPRTPTRLLPSADTTFAKNARCNDIGKARPARRAELALAGSSMWPRD